MSYPHQIPKGWIKGEPLRRFGNGPRYGLTVQPSSDFNEFIRRCEEMGLDGFVVITFDSKADLEAFLEWWHS